MSRLTSLASLDLGHRNSADAVDETIAYFWLICLECMHVTAELGLQTTYEETRTVPIL